MRCLLAAALLSCTSLAGAAARDDLKFIPHDDPAMAKAVEAARATLPAFVERSRHPGLGEEGFSVKVGLGPAGHQEFFWLVPIRVEGGIVTGILDNEPETITGYAKGQTITVPLAEVTDWMEFDGGRMRGNVTTCVLMARDGPAALADYERRYRADCSRPGG